MTTSHLQSLIRGMERKCEVEPRKKVDVPFHGDEKERFERYLERTGRKAGPLVRQLLLREMRKDEARA